MGRLLAVACVLGLTVLVGGCYEANDVALHAPGKYLGRHDPLLDQSTAARDAQLHKRFLLAETDR